MPDTSPFLLFDFPEDGRPVRRLFRNPLRVVEARHVEEVRPALAEVEAATRAGLWAAGFVSYEAAPAFDAAYRVRPGARLPLLWFGLFSAPQEPGPLPPPGPFHFGAWQPSAGPEAWRQAVAEVREAIAAGETYQLNLTLRLRASFSGDDFAAWQQLAAAQRAAYAAYLRLGRVRLLSVSPELFFAWDGERLVTRPMKGTAPRGRWEEEDAERAAWLSASEKNRAENAMIVDLLRNDAGRLALPGSVRVTRLFDVERYPTVLQLTSTVEARTRPGTTLQDVFGALFPCGSITGAPKVRTMHHIARLEDSPREVYCGAVGLVGPGARATFSVAIRTAWVDAQEGRVEYGTGGGITWDSTAADEYAEALAKARVLSVRMPPFWLLETLRLEAGRYHLLTRHLERLASSARYFGWQLPRAQVEAALAAHARAHAQGAWRVRLRLSPEGEVQVEGLPLTPLPPGPLPVALATTPVNRQDVFLFHKTTHRALYEARAAEAPGAHDVLLWNEEGELTEFTTGNLVVEREGRRLTPPRTCGLLAGTARAEALAAGEVEERVLRREDLEGATRLWLLNSVRGWVPVAWQGPSVRPPPC